MRQALKDHPHWSLSLFLNLQVPAWRKRQLYSTGTGTLLYVLLVFLKKQSMQQISSIPSNPAVSQRSTVILQCPWLQLPASVDTSGLTTLSEVWKAAAWLVYVVLTLFRLSQISEFTPQLLQMPPPSQWMAMDAGISPLCFSSFSPRCRLVPLALLLLSPSSLSLFSFVLLSSVWIWIFLLSSQGVLPVFPWSSVRISPSLDILDASWREVYPTSTYPSIILSTPICACISNEFPFLLSNIAITTYI